jgi:integrase
MEIMKIQRGYLWCVGRSWFGRWYEDTIVDGTVVRRQHSERLCTYSDSYRTKKDVQPLLDEKLKPLNERRAKPESTLSVAKYAEEFFLPFAESELKPSTVHGYKGLWRMYLKPRLDSVSVRDFTCGQATKLLSGIHHEHRLSRKSLRHCKSLLSAIFVHAKRNDVIAGDNPITDAGIPRAAAAAEQAHAYSAEEVMALLNVLTGTARTAVALMFFTGLRPGEARAVRWTDYDGKNVRVRFSIWRKHETAPKTESSVGVVPVAPVLASILAEIPHASEFVLATPSGRPVDLHNLAARAVIPVLESCKVCHKPESKHAKGKTDHTFERDASLPTWRGWYALRRGLATLAKSVDTTLAAKSLLRHSSIATTEQHYIKSVAKDAARAVDKISALFDNCGGSSRPN